MAVGLFTKWPLEVLQPKGINVGQQHGTCVFSALLANKMSTVTLKEPVNPLIGHFHKNFLSKLKFETNKISMDVMRTGYGTASLLAQRFFQWPPKVLQEKKNCM